MKNGAAYIRVSTDDQTEFSPDAQRKAVKSYAEQNGIVLADAHIYVDEGISGKRADKRPAFMQMIGAAKEKPPPFDVILVHKLDRFARSREDSVVYKSLLRKECGVKVVSVTERIEDDKFSVILEAMLEAMAEYYSLNLSDEVVKGMTEKAERGGLQTAPPLGYDVARNMLVVNGHESKTVKMIFSKFADREMTIRQIAVRLNETGARTKRGNRFESRAVQYILRNPAYIGQLRWTPQSAPEAYHSARSGPIVRDGGHEPIIDIDTWNLAQQRLTEIKELYGYRQRPEAQMRTWLKGLIFCAHCGKALIQSQTRYLQCNGYNKGQCGTSCSVRIDVIERLVRDELKAVYSGGITIDAAPKRSGGAKAEEREAVKAALVRLDMRERRAKEAYQDGVDTLKEYGESKRLLAAERESLAAHLAQIEAGPAEASGKPVQDKIKDIDTLLASSRIDMHDKYTAAHFLIRKITFSKTEGTLTIEHK